MSFGHDVAERFYARNRFPKENLIVCISTKLH